MNERSREYGGRGKVSYPKSTSFFSVILATCDRTLSSWQRVAERCHPGNMWPSIVMKQNERPNLNSSKKNGEVSCESLGGSRRGVGAKVLDYGLKISEFEFLSSYYVHFQTNTDRKFMNPFVPPAMGQIVPLLFFYKDGFGGK